MKFEEHFLYYLGLNIAPAVGALFAYIFKIHKHEAGKYIFYLLLVACCIETMVELHFQLRLGRNVFFNSISRILNLSLYSFLIYELTGKNRIVKLMATTLTLIVIICLVFIEGFNNYAPIAYSLEELSVILLCFYYFYFVFQNDIEISISDNPSFALICVVLIYHCGSLFTSIMILRITEDLESYLLYDLQLWLDGVLNFALIGMLIFIYQNEKRVRSAFN